MNKRQGNLLESEFPELDDLPEAPAAISPKKKAEEMFAFHCEQFGLPKPLRGLMFAKTEFGRKWQMDFAWPQFMLFVEIEGMGVELRCRKCFGKELIMRGRHGSVGGFKEDMIKYNSATLLGWNQLRFAASDVKSKEPIKTTVRVLAARGWRPS